MRSSVDECARAHERRAYSILFPFLLNILSCCRTPQASTNLRTHTHRAKCQCAEFTSSAVISVIERTKRCRKNNPTKSWHFQHIFILISTIHTCNIIQHSNKFHLPPIIFQLPPNGVFVPSVYFLLLVCCVAMASLSGLSVCVRVFSALLDFIRSECFPYFSHIE